VRTLRLWLLLALFTPLVAAAQAVDRPAPPAQQRRLALEAQIFNRFMNKVSTDMQLDATGRGRLEQHLRQSGQQRRALAQRSAELRRSLVRAVRDPATPDAEIDRILTEFNQLRAREEALWSQDQEALSRLLNPRQRAVFMLQWMQFNERLRDLMQQRPAGRNSPGN
jgi:hypothetical protein